MWTLVLGFFQSMVGPVFNFLNARVDANARIHLSDNETLSKVGSTVIDGASKADELNAKIRLSEGKYAPMAIMSICGFLVPFAYHTWQVVLDSSRWVPTVSWVWDWLPYPDFEMHIVGSWKVGVLPGAFETTEHAVIQSLFIGASSAAAGVAMIRALKR